MPVIRADACCSEDMPPQTAAPVTVVPPDNAIRGDWVLFHPVYTPEELRSVEVRDIYRSSQTTPSLIAGHV